MAGTFGSRFVRSSAREQRSATRTDIARRATTALEEDLRGRRARADRSDGDRAARVRGDRPVGHPTSTTTPASDTTSTTTPAPRTRRRRPLPRHATRPPPLPRVTRPPPLPRRRRPRRRRPRPRLPRGPTVTLLVKTKSGLSATAQSDAVASHGGTEVDAISALRLHIVAVPAADALTALAAYQADANVAERLARQHARRGSVTKSGASDPGYANQWALTKIGWDQVHGEHDPSGSATLAILDTGVDASTPDLAGRVGRRLVRVRHRPRRPTRTVTARTSRRSRPRRPTTATASPVSRTRA